MVAKRVARALTNGTGKKITVGVAIAVVGGLLTLAVHRGLANEREVQAATTVNVRQDRDIDGLRDSLKELKADLCDRFDRQETRQKARHQEVLEQICEISGTGSEMSGSHEESHVELLRRLIEEQYLERPTGCGGSFGEILCHEIHTRGMTFVWLAQKWGISLPVLGELIWDHCKRLENAPSVDHEFRVA